MTPLATPISTSQAQALIDELSQLATYTIGRNPQNKIVLSDSKVSGRHANLIPCTANSFILEDLGSKNGTFVNNLRIVRKIVDGQDSIKLGDTLFTINDLLTTYIQPSPVQASGTEAVKSVDPLDFTAEFAALRQVYEQYPQLKKDCRNRDKMIRTGSVIVSSVVSVGAALTTGGASLMLLPVLSSAGLSILIPTLCSSLLSTEEKLELIDKEYRDRYRCPNPDCREPFYNREWEQLAQQKNCRRCKAIWVS